MRWRPVTPAGYRCALALALAATLAGCASSSRSSNGVASKTPAEILALAKSAAAGAATVHVAGSIVNGGRPISINMELVAGKGGQGRVALDGFSIELVDADRLLYVKGSSGFYSRLAGPNAARALQGRWLRGPADSEAMAPLASLTDLGKLLDSALAEHGTLSRGAEATVNGEQAVGVTDPAAGGTLYVAATGSPYPLEVFKSGAGGAKIVFDRWNRPVTLTPPRGAIDVEQLQSGR